MIGVTIGFGNEWNAVAKRAAARMSELTGLDCRVIDSVSGEYEHSSWFKCHAIEKFPESDSFLYFDADIWCLKPWNPEQLFESHGGKFCAVLEPQHNAIDIECGRWAIDRKKYFNGGLMMFGREHKYVFENALRYHPFGRWYEQTPLNISAQLLPDLCLLPQKYNTLAHGGRTPQDLSDVVNLHWCSCNSANQIKELQNL